MTVELNEQEMGNVYVCIVSAAKAPTADANTMKYLLNLSDKFMVRAKEVKVEPKVEKVVEVEQVDKEEA